MWRPGTRGAMVRRCAAWRRRCVQPRGCTPTRWWPVTATNGNGTCLTAHRAARFSLTRCCRAESLTTGACGTLPTAFGWRLLPDVQIGIAHIKSDNKFDEIVALVCRMAANRVGVSARFDDLRDTPHALHCAQVTLRGRGDPATRVAVFDGSVLATAVVSAPGIMVKSVGDALK